MSLKNWILLMFVIAMTYPRSSVEFCMRRYVDGKWISKGSCGGPEAMSEIMKELQFRADEKKWTVLQRRMNGDVNFYRGWNDYVNGFGNSEGDFWLGLEELHERTKEDNMELEINMITKDTGTHLVAKYSNFGIGPGSDNYRLNISGFSGNATHDGLASHNNRPFSTRDADNDGLPAGNCAADREGGWWYRECALSNLNGNFNKTGAKGIWWWEGSSRRIHLRYSEMKFRRIF